MRRSYGMDKRSMGGKNCIGANWETSWSFEAQADLFLVEGNDRIHCRTTGPDGRSSSSDATAWCVTSYTRPCLHISLHVLVDREGSDHISTLQWINSQSTCDERFIFADTEPLDTQFVLCRSFTRHHRYLNYGLTAQTIPGLSILGT